MRDEAIRLFCGYDRRQNVGWHVFAQSAIEQCSAPLVLSPLGGSQHDGTTAFTYARFLVPWLCQYEGWALFADGADMLLRADLAEFWALRDPTKAVQVVQHEYLTRHPRKFVGTPMEAANVDYPRKNWSSLILFNCAARAHHYLTPEIVYGAGNSMLHRFPWLNDAAVGALPREWNWLVDEFGDNPDAKLLHWTAGNPGFAHYAGAEMSEEWHAALARVEKRGES